MGDKKRIRIPKYINKHLTPFEQKSLPIALWKNSTSQFLSPLDRMLLVRYRKLLTILGRTRRPVTPGFGPAAKRFKLERIFGRAFAKNPQGQFKIFLPRKLRNTHKHKF